jgi:hypothetical protein
MLTRCVSNLEFSSTAHLFPIPISIGRVSRKFVPRLVTRGFICLVMQIFSFDIRVLELVKLNDGIGEQINCYLVKRDMRLSALNLTLYLLVCVSTKCGPSI